MGSSTAVAFRALVMLVCMIAVPAVAIFWDSWPQVLDSLLAGRLPKLVVVDDSVPDHHFAPRGGDAPPYSAGTTAASSASHPPQLTEAPVWSPPGKPAAPSSEVAPAEPSIPPWAMNPPPPPASNVDPTSPPIAAASEGAMTPGGTTAEPAPLAELRRGERSSQVIGQRMPGEMPTRRPRAESAPDPVPADYIAPPMDQPQVAPAQHLVDPNAATPFRGPEYTIPDAVRPAPDALAASNNLQMHPTLTAPAGTAAPTASTQMHPSATDPNHGMLNLAVASEATAAPAAPAGDLFTSIQLRLRELGATYYLLETWGQDGSLYRFHCKMALSGNPRYNRHFEATDADPMIAMQRVLEQVELWRVGR